LISIVGIFALVTSDGFCLPPTAISSAWAVSGLLSPFGFLSSVLTIFDVAASDGGECLCWPVALPPGLAELVFPLSCRFLNSSAMMLGLRGEEISLPP
jgi:hypothetical protein